MRYVLQDKPVTTDHAKLGKIEFKVETPEVQTLEEAKQACGGEEALIEFVNSQISTNAKNTARAFARNYEVAEGTELTDEVKAKLIEEISAKGQQLAKDYSPAVDTERGPSAKKKAAAFDKVNELVASGRDFTREELMALLQATK